MDRVTNNASALYEQQFFQCHMRVLRLWISLVRVDEQRQRRIQQSESPDERDDLLEFESELQNLHALLTNNNLRAADVLQLADQSIRRYLELWPGTAAAVDRWWSPRHDKRAAVDADLQLVIPGVWLGSAITLRPHYRELLVHKRIHHVVYCSTTRVDADDDFLHGAERAVSAALETTARAFPTIESANKTDLLGTIFTHSITLFEVGQHEFLIRRRDKSVPPCVSFEAMDQICSFLQPLVKRIRLEQYDREITTATQTTYVEQFDGVLFYGDTGTTAAMVVCMATLMRELDVSYDIALRLANWARPYTAPSAFFEHILREYERIKRNEQPQSQNLDLE